jgi:hypothetical protein
MVPLNYGSRRHSSDGRAWPVGKSHRKKFTAPTHLLLDDEIQPMLKRLGENCSDVNSKWVDRIEHVCRVADVILSGQSQEAFVCTNPEQAWIDDQKAAAEAARP